MFSDYRPLWAEINLDNFAHNVRSINRLLGNGTEYISIVKADGYGHGAVEIAEACIENGIKWLAVSILDEAIELRNAGIKNPILILGFTPYNKTDVIVDNDIRQACYSYELAEALSASAVKQCKTAKIHIAVDTGMGRIGFLPNKESVETIVKISKLPNLKIEGLFTHFAVADEKNKEYTYQQFEKYNAFLKLLEENNISVELKHVGNSAAIIDLPDMHLDAVRPGIIQYGLYPSDEVLKSRIEVKPVMSLKACIIHVKEVEAGTSISYGRRFITEKKSKIATLPVGYADGYPRLLFGKAKVIVNGKFAPVVGTICMDQCMIDVTGIDDVKVGDEVITMGSDGKISITADDLAAMLGTINYEIVCMFSKRIPRVYLKNGEVVKVKNYLVK